MKPEDEKTQEEKLEEEISEVMSRIKNTEYDLANSFRGNSLLQKKLETSKSVLDEKQQLLTKIKTNPTSAEELCKIENKIQDKLTTPISQEQEKFIEKAIEDEL